MQGRVFRRSKDGPWIIRYDLPVGQNEKRKQKQESCPGLSKKQAEQKLRDIMTAINNGTYTVPSKTTVAEYMTKWLEESAKPTVGAKTYERYEEIVRQHIIPALGNKYLDKLRPTDIQTFYSEALKSGRIDGKGGLSAQSVLHIHRVLHRAMEQAVKWQISARNPVDAVQPPRVGRKEIAIIEPMQIEQLLTTARDTVFYIQILLAVTTGMRRGEILGLKWDDIDLATGKLTLRRSLGQTRNGLVVKDPKTHGSRRTIQLPKVTVNKLIAHKGCQAIEKAQLGKAYDDNGLVCAQPDGKPVPPDYISSNFRFVVKRAGLPPMRFHDLRHSAATMLIKSGVPVKVVSERLGHSTIVITQDIYAHVLPDMQQQAADVVDTLFNGKIGIVEE